MPITPQITRISQLQPDPRNANLGTERGRSLLERSLRDYGAGRSILIDREGRIIAGNKTIENAKALGLEEIEVVQTDGSKIIAVQRVDLDMASDPKARALAIADNRTGELNLEWAGDVLAEMSREIDLSGFFSTAELAAVLGKNVKFGDIPEPKVDQADEMLGKWGVKSGQLWAIKGQNGPHWLLCGDCTQEATVARLWAAVGQNRPILMVTDPPYGVEYDPEWRAQAGVNRNRGKMGPVSNDDRWDWTPAWKLFPGQVAYVWHAGVCTAMVQTSLETAGFEIRSSIIWAKDRFALSRGHYHWQHEPCFYAVRERENAHWLGARDQSTLWNIPAREDSGRGHGTQKPVECMARPLQNHEGNVYDPFLGTGTTMCAAEKLHRTCYGLEIEPKYVAVSLERLSEMGMRPELTN